jgi:SAM-dependent methyltransferase
VIEDRVRFDVRALIAPTWQVSPQIARTLAELPPAARVLDVGAGGRRVKSDAVCVDVARGPNVDVVADAHSLPFEDSSFDLVIATGMLNLCLEPLRVLREARRVLRAGGLLHLEVGMFQPYNPEPEDYWRFTQPGLRKLALEAGFEHVRSGAHIGPFSAMTNNAVALAGKLAEGPGPARKLVRGAVHVGLSWIKYLDAFLDQATLDGSPFAYGIYYVGRAVKTT